MSNNINKKDEPAVDRWFEITLGSSFQDNPSSKFFILRYEFKPASIDKNQPGKLHKTSNNIVAVEFQNNQPGKPKVSFEGSSEDYKDNDAVLFFDGKSFRLQRLHRSVIASAASTHDQEIFTFSPEGRCYYGFQEKY
ncbi:ELL-associated factor 1 [Tanacetum coccineum]